MSPAEGPSQRIDVAAFLFNAAGRSPRAGYLVGMAAVILLAQPLEELPQGWLTVAYAATGGVLGFVIWSTLTARRLHDLGMAGWWVAPLLLLACLAPITAPLAPWAGAGCGFAAIVLQVVLMLWPGQPRFNRFGPAPG